MCQKARVVGCDGKGVGVVRAAWVCLGMGVQRAGLFGGAGVSEFDKVQGGGGLESPQPTNGLLLSHCQQHSHTLTTITLSHHHTYVSSPRQAVVTRTMVPHCRQHSHTLTTTITLSHFHTLTPVRCAGKLWGYQNYGVEPDLMSLAKPLAGGLPIGAVVLKQKVADVMKPGEGEKPEPRGGEEREESGWERGGGSTVFFSSKGSRVKLVKGRKWQTQSFAFGFVSSRPRHR